MNAFLHCVVFCVCQADGLLGYYAHKSDYHVSVSVRGLVTRPALFSNGLLPVQSFQGAKKSSGNYVLEMPHPPDLSRLENTQANSNTQQESQSQAIESQQLMPPSATATSGNKVKVARGEALLVPLATGRLPLKRAAERGGYGRRLDADFIRLGQRSLTEDEMKATETKRLQIMVRTTQTAETTPHHTTRHLSLSPPPCRRPPWMTRRCRRNRRSLVRGRPRTRA